MERVDGRLLLSASDLINYLECAHLTHLDLRVASGVLELSQSRTDAAELVARKSDEHEAAHLQALRADGHQVVEIPRQTGPGALERGAP